MTHYEKIDPYFDQDNYAINRAPLYRDRRDFVIQDGDTGKVEDYPVGAGSRDRTSERK